MLELGLAVLADILALLESLKLAKVWFIQSSQRDSVIVLFWVNNKEMGDLIYVLDFDLWARIFCPYLY